MDDVNGFRMPVVVGASLSDDLQIAAHITKLKNLYTSLQTASQSG